MDNDTNLRSKKGIKMEKKYIVVVINKHDNEKLTHLVTNSRDQAEKAIEAIKEVKYLYKDFDFRIEEE